MMRIRDVVSTCRNVKRERFDYQIVIIDGFGRELYCYVGFNDYLRNADMNQLDKLNIQYFICKQNHIVFCVY